MADKNTQKELNKISPLPRPSPSDIEETFKSMGKIVEKPDEESPSIKPADNEENVEVFLY